MPDATEALRANFEHSKRMHLSSPRFSTDEIGALFAEIDRLRAALAAQPQPAVAQECTCSAADMPFGRCCKAQPAPAAGPSWVDANVSGNPALMQAMRNHATPTAQPAPEAMPLEECKIHDGAAAGLWLSCPACQAAFEDAAKAESEARAALAYQRRYGPHRMSGLIDAPPQEGKAP